MITKTRFKCASTETPVLCADLIWRPAGELEIGRELLAFEEEPETRRGRRFKLGVVTANVITKDDLISVKTNRGIVQCNRSHLWLTRPGDRILNWRWVTADNLKIGDTVHNVVDTWETANSWEAGWLAGLYDGEGCLTMDKNKRSQLSIAQRESKTATRIEKELKARVDQLGVYRVAPAVKPAGNVSFYSNNLARRFKSDWVSSRT